MDHNQEVYHYYLRAEGLKRDIELARDLVRDGQHSSAVDILTSVIEVTTSQIYPNAVFDFVKFRKWFLIIPSTTA